MKEYKVIETQKEPGGKAYERNGCTRPGSSQYDLLECVEDFSADNIFHG